MPARFPLQTLLEVADRRLDAATAELGALRERCRQLRDELAMREAKLQDQRETLTSAMFLGLRADRLRDALWFLEQQTATVKLRQEALAHAEQEGERAQLRWLQLRRDWQGLDALRLRHVRAQGAAEMRREQRMQDEFAALTRKDSPF
jgi:flagellar FliJ protein